MKQKLITALIAVLFLTTSAFAQLETGNYYTTVKIKYGLKREGIVYELIIDIGTDKSHPLLGKVENVEAGVLVKDNETQQVFTNEVDLFSYLKKLGWVICETAEIKVIGSPYTNYLFCEANRQ